MAIDDFRKEFIAYLEQVRGRAVATCRAYDFDLAHFSTWLKDKGIEEARLVDTLVIEDYLQQLSTSMTTKARIRSSISSFFRFLLSRNEIASNPCERLGSIKLISKEPDYLTPQQCLAFMEAVAKASPYFRHRDTALMQILLKSGLRRAEVVGLNIEDVDLLRGSIRVTRKGGKRQNIPLHSELVANLSTYMKHEARLTGPLFMSRRNNRLSPSELWHIVKKYAQAAGLSSTVTTHSLRHSYASTLLGQNVQLSFIQNLMGHKHLGTTARYLHFQEYQVRAALESVSF